MEKPTTASGCHRHRDASPEPCSHGSAQGGTKSQKSEARTQVRTATDRLHRGPRPGLDSESWASFQKPRESTARPEAFFSESMKRDVYLELAGPPRWQNSRDHAAVIGRRSLRPGQWPPCARGRPAARESRSGLPGSGTFSREPLRQDWPRRRRSGENGQDSRGRERALTETEARRKILAKHLKRRRSNFERTEVALRFC